jgi:hypothetical protein
VAERGVNAVVAGLIFFALVQTMEPGRHVAERVTTIGAVVGVAATVDLRAWLCGQGLLALGLSERNLSGQVQPRGRSER